MGHYAELYATNHFTAPPRGQWMGEDAPCLTVKYRLPAVWLALFEPDDVQVFHTFDDPDDREWLAVHVATPREAALRRLAARRPWLLAHFPTLREEWLQQFEQWLRALPQGWVHLSTDDIAGMVFSPDEWAEELPRILAMFDDAQPPSSRPPSLGPLPTYAPPPPPPESTIAKLARWWRREPAPPTPRRERTPAPEPRPGHAAADGWKRYNLHFASDDLARSPQAWAFLGSGEDGTVTW